MTKKAPPGFRGSLLHDFRYQTVDELIVRRAEADGLAVLDGGAPVGVRMRGGEVVVRMVMRVRDDAVRDWPAAH